jgi:hypothetical protein
MGMGYISSGLTWKPWRMSLPQTDTRSSLTKHWPSLAVGVSVSNSSKCLGLESLAAFMLIKSFWQKWRRRHGRPE